MIYESGPNKPGTAELKDSAVRFGRTFHSELFTSTIKFLRLGKSLRDAGYMAASEILEAYVENVK